MVPIYISRRHLLAAGASSIAIATLPSCSAETPPTAPASVRMLTWGDPDNQKLLKEQLGKYQAEAGLETVLQAVSGSSVYPDKLRTELLGGQGPDIFRIWGGQLAAPYVKAKQAADLTSLYDARGWSSKINQTATDGMSFDGAKYGVPIFSAAMGIWYSRTVFERAGIDKEPTSYAELEEVNSKLLLAGVTPAALGGKGGWHLMRLVEYLLETKAGSELHDKLLTGEASWDTPEVVETFAAVNLWQDKGWLPKGVLGLEPEDIEPAFIQGKAGYTITGQWIEGSEIARTKRPATDFGTFAAPTDQPVQRHSGFVEGYMINANSKKQERAADLIDFLIRPETQKAMLNGQSPITGAEPDPETAPLSYRWAEIAKSNPFYLVLDQALPKRQADQYFAVQSQVLQRSLTPAEAAKRMQEIMSARKS